MNSSNAERKRSFRCAVTGANSGLGLESVRQIAASHRDRDDGATRTSTTIFLLCRSKDSAENAIASLSREYPNVAFIFVPFDSSDLSTVTAAAETLSSQEVVPDGSIIDGILLNAGGFTHDRKGTLCQSGATVIAETNLIGHAILINALMQSKRIARGSRVVFSGSEAGLGEPFAIKWGNDLDYYVTILNGKRYGKHYNPADAYQHIKGMVAFYCSALARHNEDIYFVTISPGSTQGTGLMDQGSFPKALNYMFKGFIKLSGQHSVAVGAKRYIDAVMGGKADDDCDDDDRNGKFNYYQYPSGTFVTSKKGYIGEVCDATDLKKGKVFAEEAKQELVYAAVQKFIL